MESKTNASFVRATGEKLTLDTTVTYYYCNRSGYFLSRGNQRHSKSQGTSKLNTYCTAAITVRKNENQILVSYCPTHYGHKMLLGHLRIPRNERQAIAGKLLQGVTFERILDDIHDSMDNSINRIHLTTRKDIANIQQAYKLREAHYHEDDATSVKIWVDAMKKHTPNPVLLHKNQGQPTTSECKNLNEQDFMLVLQTPLQAEVLKKCGHNKVLCIDDTHGTNSYDFYLTTVLVIDEFGDGYPIGVSLTELTILH